MFFTEKTLDKILLVLVALAGGGLMGGAFLHLLPEAIHEFEHKGGEILTVFLFVILGFVLFLMIEQYLHWHHHHHLHDHQDGRKDCCPKKPVAYLILVADGFHNLIDGLIIAASFIVNPAVGIITTIAVALHEIPQEIGDFGVLVHGGYKRGKALLFNFISASIAIVGGVVGFFIAESIEGAMVYMLPIAAGGFIYIAASDLVPEIKHGERGLRMLLNLFVFLLGIGLMLLMHFIPGLEH